MKCLRLIGLGSALLLLVCLSSSAVQSSGGLNEKKSTDASSVSSATTSSAASAGGLTATITSLDWRARALAACARRGCDGLLLIAIALVETQGQPDPDDTWHEDKVSWGRYGMQVLTGARWVYGHWRSRLSGHEAIAVEQALMDPERGADLAAQQLSWCQRRTKRTASAARCWNPRDGDYPRRLMMEYKRLKKEAAINQKIAYAKGTP